MVSLVRRLAVGIWLSSLPAAAQQVASFPPDDARIEYSGYACGHIGPERASFARELPGSWVCQQEKMSPDVRATFVADASQVRFELDYAFAGFYCGLEEPDPVSWEFGLIIDGVPEPTGASNPLYPLSRGSTQWIRLGQGAGAHEVTLVWPCAADVDLLRVHLKETRGSTSPRLLAPPLRSRPQLTVFGTSITQGLDASHVLNTYPARLGALKDWNVVNLGFAGRTTQSSDARLAAGITPCVDGHATAPDLVLLNIGTNDFLFFGQHTRVDRFEERYLGWISQFRFIRPTTPILCVTPLPRGDECEVTTRTMEEYRERIRTVIERRADPRIYLFEGRDLIALPPAEGDPLFDEVLLHPTDLGFEQIADRLSRFNLVRNPGFELRPLANCREVTEPEPYLWADLGSGASSTIGPVGDRVLAISSSEVRAQMVYGLSAGDRFVLKASGLATAASSGRLTLEFLDEDGVLVGAPLVLEFSESSWRRLVLEGMVPSGAIHGRLKLSKSLGPGQFLVDDLELTVKEF